MSLFAVALLGNERAQRTSMIEKDSMLLLLLEVVADGMMLERHSTWRTGKQRALAGSCYPVDGWHRKHDRTLDEKTKTPTHERSNRSSDVAQVIIIHGCVSRESLRLRRHSQKIGQSTRNIYP